MQKKLSASVAEFKAGLASYPRPSRSPATSSRSTCTMISSKPSTCTRIKQKHPPRREGSGAGNVRHPRGFDSHPQLHLPVEVSTPHPPAAICSLAPAKRERSSWRGSGVFGSLRGRRMTLSDKDKEASCRRKFLEGGDEDCAAPRGVPHTKDERRTVVFRPCGNRIADREWGEEGWVGLHFLRGSCCRRHAGASRTVEGVTWTDVSELLGPELAEGPP